MRTTNILDRFSLEGKKAIVTGGVQGIGEKIVHALREAGATVAVVDVNPAVQTEQMYGEWGFCCDLRNQAALETVFHQITDKLGGLDILVNNAGVLHRSEAENETLEAWQRVIDVNLTAVFSLCRLASEIMIPQGSGKIINMASMLSFFGGFRVASYSASKGAVAQLTKTLSNEWAKYGIHVNAMAPGYFATTINTSLIADTERSQQILARIPAGRWGSPEDVQGLVVFLASQASDYITGAIIPVDGGYLVR